MSRFFYIDLLNLLKQKFVSELKHAPAVYLCLSVIVSGLVPLSQKGAPNS